MTRHTTDEPLEQAALYALGALDATEAARFEAHLAEGCARCSREVQGFAAVVADLGHDARAARPSAALRQRVLAGARDADVRGIVVRAEELRWEVGNTPGVAIKHLLGEPAVGRHTALVRLAPRERWTFEGVGPHREVYVLNGQLGLGDVTLAAGEYAATTAGDAVAGDDGCTLVLSHVTMDGEGLPGTTLVRPAEGDWRPGGAPGVTVKRLLANPTTRAITALVRMDPGARLRGHRHVSSERFYMLAGDLHVSGHELGPGAVCAAGAGTVHDATYSRGGCEFLLIATEVELI